MKKYIKQIILIPLTLIILFSIIYGADRVIHFYRPGTAVNHSQTSAAPTRTSPVPAKDKITTQKMTIGAVGDILIHDRVYNPARTRQGFNFKPAFSAVKKVMQKPDMLTANQESVLGGAKLGLSSYPMFNSPQEVGLAVKDAGVDISSTANNHALDKGEAGIVAELKFMNRIGMKHVGTYMTPADANKTVVTRSHGIRVAWLSYTFGTNGMPIPEHKRYLVNLIDKKKISRDLLAARKKADLVVVSMHWGIEYQRLPDQQQKALARFVVNSGADIIFGAHPHVLQPMNWVKARDGRTALVVYSLGNFFSGQKDGIYKQLGGMATIRVTKKIRDGKTISVRLGRPSFFPTYVTHKGGMYRVVPLSDAGAYGLKNAHQKYREIMHHELDGVQTGRQ
ncbi:CapA family protein [Sporolactobacillus vineae]|uniref:CapA family protein n=1 Tax=Sporolactobacillus vineae TaxID=444463 RepID=UPI00028816B5|nr:CapA family protein [Sporolactobacillus vineae]